MSNKEDGWFWSVVLFVSAVLLVPCLYCRGESVKLEVTGYCTCKVCCGPNAKGITASGVRAKPYVTIAAPRSWKYGTRVRVPGWGSGVVQDRGGMIKSKGNQVEKGRVVKYDRIDLCFPDHRSALKWGRRVVECEVTDVGGTQKSKSTLRQSSDTHRKQRVRTRH